MPNGTCVSNFLVMFFRRFWGVVSKGIEVSTMLAEIVDRMATDLTMEMAPLTPPKAGDFQVCHFSGDFIVGKTMVQ